MQFLIPISELTICKNTPKKENMMLNRVSKRSRWNAAGFLAVCALLFGVPTLAEDTKPAPSAAAVAPAVATDRDPRAMEILLRMANTLANAPAIGVTVLSSYDAIQKDGEFIEFGDRRRIELQRPDRLRVEVERSDGEKGSLVFDGKAITAYKPADNIYAVVEKPGTVDAALVYVVKDLQIPSHWPDCSPRPSHSSSKPWLNRSTTSRPTNS
jgi:hypothetical protein